MGELIRLFDSDEASLARRLAQQDLPADAVVARFTYWYTSRPPAFEAVVIAPSIKD